MAVIAHMLVITYTLHNKKKIKRDKNINSLANNEGLCVIQENIPLCLHTTMKTGGSAKFFVQVNSLQDLKYAYSFAKSKNVPVHVLGGGSNTVFSDLGFQGLVIKNEIKGIELVGVEAKNLSEKEPNIKIKAMSGENWDEFVAHTISSGWFGLENLSLVPGTVGASPIQNIGAYGVEVCDLIMEVCAYDPNKDEFINFLKEECKFGYRSSLFKEPDFNHLFIVSVTFGLHTNSEKINISYKDLANWYANCEQNKIECLKNPSMVREIVCKIRTEKLPPLEKFGTAGSFFKNPVISKSHYNELVKIYPKLPGFNQEDGNVKVPLGWILDNICNAKEIKIGNVSVYEKQALVIVNHGGASSEDVMLLSHKLENLVKEKTKINIEREVIFVN